MRYFEDFSTLVGQTIDIGTHQFTSEAIIAFARDYDPQPMHTDPELARGSIYGGLIASGWHTAALMMRLFADNFLSPASSVASPGLDELRWRLISLVS